MEVHAEGLGPERLARLRERAQDGNIVLVGFMGAGKSEVGRRLARALGRFFADVDRLVEARAGRSIPELFRVEGEEGFRRREAEVVRQLARMRGCVIATGGGAVMREENWRALEQSGVVVWLKAPLDVLLARADARDRPLLQEGRDRAAALYSRREPLYARAHVTVDTEHLQPEEVVERIAGILRDAGLAAGESGESGDGVRAEPLSVDLGERAYPVWIGTGLLPRVGRLMAEQGHPAGRRVLVVTSPLLRRLYGDMLAGGLEEAGFVPSFATMPEGEGHKNLDTVRALYSQAVAAGLDRTSAVVALGGGVVGDVAGFVAATFLRGLDFYQVPTTLLAQVDAAVGGKVGVNLPEGKNLVGAFHQPRAVYADMGTLFSLPERELAAGLAEVVKHGFIAAPDLLARLEERAEAVMERAPEELAFCVRRSCEIKADVVRQDEREAGVRAWLNFGHTFAHGLEAAAEYEGILHGEAVSVGMVAALHLSADLGWLDRREAERGERLLRRLGLPVRAPHIDPERAWAAMGRDKKVRAGKMRLVLLQGVGKPVVTGEVDPALVRSALDMVCRSR